MKRAKHVDWVDTNNEAFYVSYSFPISITNRYWVFWANAKKGWRKVLNIADKLAKRSRLSVVFLYGEIKGETLSNYLAKLNNGQLIVLRADYISNDIIELISGCERWLKGLQKNGGRKKSEDGEYLFDVDEKVIKHTIIDPALNADYNKFLRAKEAVRRIEDDVFKNGYSVIGEVGLKHVRGNELIADDLLNIAKEIYPFGVESEAFDIFAYKRAATSRLVDIGLLGQTNDPLVEKLKLMIDGGSDNMQLSLFGYSVSANAFIDHIHEWCDSALKEKGYFKTSELFYELTKPPYGMYECNYYYYLYACAFKRYMRKGLFYGDQNMHTKEADTVYWCRDNIFYPTIFNQTPKQRHFVKRFCKLFDIDEDIKDLPKAVQYARTWTTEHICCDTVDRISHTLFEILSEGFKGEHYAIDTERYDDWLTDDKYDYLYAKLRTVDTDFKARLEREYGKEKTALYWKFFYWKGSAVSWLHKKENVDEKVEHYMKQIICRECGNMIQPLTTTDLSYEAIETIDGKMETREFTVKQVLGLNKKYFGRYQNEYFCIPCMCEILGLTAFELWDKMHQFKEAGCELF